MMKFENNISQEEKKEERLKQKVYRKVIQDILDSDYYSFNFESKKVFSNAVEESGIAEEDLQLYILERFNKENQALPGKLGERYARLKYSPEAIKEKMETGLDFYEAVSSIAKELNAENIILDDEVVNGLVADAKADLLNAQAA